MNIEKAVEYLMSGEGKKLNCSTQSTVKSFTREDSWFVLIETSFEGASDTDKMEMPMGRFQSCYRKQQFVESGPIDPVELDHTVEGADENIV